MTLTVKQVDGGVKLIYEDSDGNTASVSIVGMSKSEVDSRADELAKTHNLSDKAGREPPY